MEKKKERRRLPTYSKLDSDGRAGNDEEFCKGSCRFSWPRKFLFTCLEGKRCFVTRAPFGLGVHDRVFGFFIVARGRVTRPDPVPQLITASQTQQIAGDSELSVDSPHTRALEVDLGQIHEHKHADRRNNTHLLALKPYQSA